MSQALMEHLVVPVANEEDARATATALTQYPFEQITVVHVVEKAGGAPDKLSVEQAERIAEESFIAFREIIPDVETEITYSRDVVDAINALTIEMGASAIAFRSRGGGRLARLISGDTALRLVTDTDRPVIALHEGEEVEH